MPETKKLIRKQILPLLPLRGLTIFPYMVLHFDVGRVKSIKALEEAMVSNQMIFLVAQRDAKTDNPEIKDLYEVGTIAKVKQLLKLPGDTIRVLVEGVSRARISEVVDTEPFCMVEVEEKIYYEDALQLQMEALIRNVQKTFDEYVKLSNKVSPDAVISISAIENPAQIADVIAANLNIKNEEKQLILEEFNPSLRLARLLKVLVRELKILEIENEISSKVRKQIDKSQKEYYLREQLKVIQTELGDKDGIGAEVEEYKSKIAEAKLPEEAEKKALKEVDRLFKTPQGSAEGSVIRNYLDWILDLPWSAKTEESTDLRRAQEILEEDHYGLEKVKERILEYLAIRMLSKDLKGPIICLVGPPGVGKTSIAKSIARCLNRKYVRMSLGGVKDESEIRGHRKTYVGSMPGRIVNALKQAGSNNPLILLDEIDKMSSDFRGDPASAMLEVLDAEQNHSFRDHYLEVPLDLSQVLFLTTANNLDTVPRPLLDRMEIIHISGYTEEEKLNIAQKYLIPKQLKEHGLKKSNLSMDEQTVRDTINYYTREAGVRSLEREVGNICRKAARILVAENKKSIKVSTNTLEKYLGTKRFRYDKANIKDEIGMVTGLAWTPVGGVTLSIEVNLMNGSGKLELTGQLGDVMKESAKAGMSYIRSKVEEFKIDPEFYKNTDIHIHVPEGATPKDGPSAGISMATAMISVLTGIPVKKDVAMTGEITLRGRVLPIGGLKEKVLAANRAGITTIIVPIDNKKDIDEIPENVRKKMKFVFAETMDTVLETALVKYKVHKTEKTDHKKAILPIIEPQQHHDRAAMQ